MIKTLIIYETYCGGLLQFIVYLTEDEYTFLSDLEGYGRTCLVAAVELEEGDYEGELTEEELHWAGRWNNVVKEEQKNIAADLSSVQKLIVHHQGDFG